MASPSHRGLAKDVAVLACGLTAGIHAGLVPEHLHESPLLGASFALAAALAAVLTVELARSDAARWQVAAAVLLAGLVAAYAASRTVGLPAVGVEHGSLDPLGLSAKAIETAGLGAAVWLLRHSTRSVGRLPAGRRIQEVPTR